MSHPDEETLVAFALGEDLGPEIAAHVDECASCRTEVRGTTDVVRATQGFDLDPVALEDPPERVWEAINVQLAQDRRGPATGVRRIPSYLPPPGDLRRSRPWWRTPQAAAATVGGLVVGAAAALLVFFVLPNSKPAVPEVPDLVAAGRLVPLKGESANGSAQVYDRDGQRTVTVRLREDAVDTNEYVEAWLFEPGTAKMVSLGVMDNSRQTFAVPGGLDLNVFSAVDISREPLDGDPAHSTVSMARGELEKLNGPQSSGAADDRDPLDGARLDDAETAAASRRFVLHFPGLDDEQPVELQARGAEAVQRHETTLASTSETSGGVEPAAQTSSEPAARASAKPGPQDGAGGSSTGTSGSGAVTEPQVTEPQVTKSQDDRPQVDRPQVDRPQVDRPQTCRTSGLGQVDPFGLGRGDVLGLGGVVAVLREVGLLPQPAAATQPKQCRPTSSAGLSGQGQRPLSTFAESRPGSRASTAAPRPSQQARKALRPAGQHVRKPAAHKPAAKRHDKAKTGGRGGRHAGQRTVDQPQRPSSGFWFGSGGNGWFF